MTTSRDIKIAIGLVTLLLLQTLTLPLVLVTPHVKAQLTEDRSLPRESAGKLLLEDSEKLAAPRGSTRKAIVGETLKSRLKAGTYGKIVKVVVDLASPNVKNAEILEMWQKATTELKEKGLKGGSFQEYEQITDETRKEVYQYLRRSTQETRDAVKRQIIDLGGEILGEIVTTGYLLANIPPENIERLRLDSRIQRIYAVPRIHVQLDVAAPTINASTWWEGGYNGSKYADEGAVEVAVLDTGINGSHPALMGKVVASESFVEGESPLDLHGHGTHVAGIVASTDETYRGIGYGANLLNGKCMFKNGSGDAIALMDAAEWSVTEVADTAEIISTSLGAPYDEVTADGTSFLTKFVDAFTEYYHVIWCTAAGNEGDHGDETINVPGDAYNAITVGATYDNGDADRDNDYVPSYSSKGLTVDGRVKPDLVAPGTYITSADAGYAQGSDWTTRSGTSMATPMVAGGAALILPFLASRYDFASPNLPLKALLINTAQDMEVSSSTQGFGYMALAPAWDTKTQLYQTTLGDGERKSYWIRLTKDQDFTATTVWSKHVSSYSGWSSDFHDVSNLDLELRHPNGSLLTASNYSQGTVEKIHLPNAPAAGLYRLVIHGKSVSSAIGNETIALASTHTLLSAPLSFKIDPPTLEGTLGTNLLIHANVTNHASENISNLEASLSLPNKLGLYSNQNESKALLEPNASWLPSWNISLTGLGEFQFSITLTAATLNESFRQSGIIIIRTETDALTVEAKNEEGTIDDTLQLNITVTNLASATVHNLTLTLSLPTQITTVNDVQRRKEALAPSASWRPTWELTLEQAGNFTYNVTLSSPDLLGQIETSGGIVVHEKADEVPTRWILIGLGIVGIVVLLLLIRKGTKKGNKSSRLRFSSLYLKI